MFNKHLSRILILLLIVQVAIGVFAFPVNQAKAAGRTYYVDSVAGSDSYDGLEQTHTTGSTGPWQTIAHINAMGCGSGAGQLNAGDFVLFDSGETWREQLTVPCSGTSGNAITFGSYGNGTAPIISGADVLSSWTPSTYTVLSSPQYVGGNYATSGTTSDQVTYTSTAGNLLFIAVSGNDTGATLTITDSAGQTWSAGPSVVGNTSINKIFYKSNSAAVIWVAVTASHTWGSLTASLLEYSSITPVSAEDGTGVTASLASGAYTTASFPVTVGDLVIGFINDQWGGATVGSGFVITPVGDSGRTSEYQTASGATATIVFGGSGGGSGILGAAFKPVTSSTNVWYSSVSVTPNQVFRNGVRLASVASESLLGTGKFYADGAGKVYIADDPTGQTIEASVRDDAITISSKNYLTFNGLTFTKGNSTAQSNLYVGGSTGLTVQNCESSWSAGSGYLVAAATSANITGGSIHDNLVFGLAAWQGGAGVGTENYAQGIEIYNNDYHGMNISDNYWIIQNNYVHDNGSTTGPGAVGIEIYSQSGSYGLHNIVRNNLVTGTIRSSISGEGEGIMADDGAQYNTIAYNVVTGNQGVGILVNGSNYPNHDNSILNNTTYNDFPVADIYGSRFEIEVNGPNPNTKIKNSIAWGVGSGIEAIAVSPSSIDQSGLEITNNIWYTPSSSYFYLWNNIGGNNLATWNTLTGVGTDLNSNPLLTNPGSSIFTLQPSSPAIDAGLNLGSTYGWGLDPASTWPSNIILDNENNYGAGWDMGAYVYTQTSTPSVVMTAPTSTTVSGIVTVSASSTAVSPASISSVQFYLDGSSTLLGTATSSPYTISWNTATTTNGTHTLYALATDNYSNTATSTSITVTVAHPSASSVTASPDTVTVATSTLTIATTFSKAMDTSVTPSVTFNKDTSDFTQATSSWSNGSATYTAAYTVASLVTDSGITATISGAEDENGDVAPDVTSNSFAIDTLAPTGTPVATAVVNVASSTLTVVTTFSKAMNTSVAPSITFTPDISADLTAGAASWTDATHYSAAYAATSSVDVSAVATVHGAKDPDGNTAADTSSATFIVDTLTTAAAISSGGGGGAVYYALNLTKSGSGSGTITGAGLTCGSSCTTSLVYGQTASLTAIADSDSIFAGWNGACSPSGTSTVCSLTMTADQTATAMFNLLSTPASNPPVSIPSPITPSIPVRLINDSGTFYLVINSVLHGITNPGILNSYGLTFSDAQPATAETQALPTGANLLPNNGSLVKAPKSSTVYLISQGEKYGFASSKVFTSLGFKFKSVLVVTAPELNLLPLGGIISNPKSQHRPGVDINKNGTVYWIGADNQLHGYPSLATYNSWRMADDFSVVVPANAADMVLPVGSLVSARVLQ